MNSSMTWWGVPGGICSSLGMRAATWMSTRGYGRRNTSAARRRSFSAVRNSRVSPAKAGARMNSSLVLRILVAGVNSVAGQSTQNDEYSEDLAGEEKEEDRQKDEDSHDGSRWVVVW